MCVFDSGFCFTLVVQILNSKSGVPAKGMSLSKGKKSDAFFDALRQEEHASGIALPAAGVVAAVGAASSAAAAAHEEAHTPQARSAAVQSAVFFVCVYIPFFVAFLLLRMVPRV